MAEERHHYCDYGECEAKPGRTLKSWPHVPSGVIEVREGQPGSVDDRAHHFCSWACLMHFAAAVPEPITIPCGDPED